MVDRAITTAQSRASADRIAYVRASQGDQFKPKGFYFRNFSSWHAGSRLRKLPLGVRQLGMTLRNWRVFWRPRKLEFRYMSDGFATKSRLAFMDDAKFRDAYDRMILATGYPTDPGLHFRVHQAIWSASLAKRIDGDFVECGTGRGMMFSAILDYLKDWSTLGKSAWLFDTFSPYFLNPDSGVNDVTHGVREGYAESLESTQRNFSQWERVHCIAGLLPDTLSLAPIKKIAFLHLDLNYAPTEEAVLRRLWPLISTGGIVLLDDYGQTGSQNETMSKVAKDLGVEILTTGSAQGIIIKG